MTRRQSLRVLPFAIASLCGAHALLAAPAADRSKDYIGYYAAANARLATQSAEGRVVFLGDSITQRWSPHPMGRANPRFVGRGIAGQTADQILARVPTDVVALGPKIVHIMAGTNDFLRRGGPQTPDQVFASVSKMVELAQSRGIKVIIASVPPITNSHARPDLARYIQALNGRLARYAARRGATYVDYWPVLANASGGMNPAYSDDGTHPNRAGYEAMAPLTEAAIARALRG